VEAREPIPTRAICSGGSFHYEICDKPCNSRKDPGRHAKDRLPPATCAICDIRRRLV
jgi:hypothetical protein